MFHAFLLIVTSKKFHSYRLENYSSVITQSVIHNLIIELGKFSFGLIHEVYTLEGR